MALFYHEEKVVQYRTVERDKNAVICGYCYTAIRLVMVAGECVCMVSHAE